MMVLGFEFFGFRVGLGVRDACSCDDDVESFNPKP
jgi:hypothetical protein